MFTGCFVSMIWGVKVQRTFVWVISVSDAGTRLIRVLPVRRYTGKAVPEMSWSTNRNTL
jgi:hypothetical protein